MGSGQTVEGYRPILDAVVRLFCKELKGIDGIDLALFPSSSDNSTITVTPISTPEPRRP